MAFPRPLTSFFGRAAEMARVGELSASGRRLITLWGPGGAGKTRLALELLHQAAAVRPAYFCDLSEATSADDICRAVAGTLGVKNLPASRGSAVDHVARHLAAKGPLWLCLDNFEQVASHAPSTLTPWLASAPELFLLVTSREKLRIAGEVSLDIPPLDPTAEARALLYDRARAAGARLADDDATMQSAATLCRALDGSPLAIELAAGRLGVMGIEELLRRLDRDFDLLTTRMRDGVVRHRSLSATLDASWALLSPVDARALARLSVFPRPFDARDAAAVLGDREDDAVVPAPEAEVLAVLERLRDRSLVADEAPGEPASGPARFRLLDAIRRYAGIRLVEMGEDRATACLHAHDTLARCDAATHAMARDPHAGVATLEHLAGDVVAVFRWSVEAGDSPARTLGARALLGLMPWFEVRGPVDAHADRLREALEGPLARELAQRLRLARARLCRVSGQLDEAGAAIEAGVALARAERDTGTEASFACEDAELAWARGDMTLARTATQAALALCPEATQPREHAALLLQMARVHQSEARADLSRPLLERALVAFRGLGDRLAEGRILATLGFIRQDLGDLAGAERDYRAALSLHRAWGHRAAEAIAGGYLGNVARRRGDVELAGRHYEEAIALLEREGSLAFQGVFWMDWGIALSIHGDAARAEATFARALHRLDCAGQRRCRGLVLGHLGALAANRGSLGEAEHLWSDAERELERLGDRIFSQTVGLLRELGDVARLRLRHRADPLFEERLARVRRRLKEAGELEIVPDHVHFARILLRRELDRVVAPGDAIVVDEHGAWFQPPGEPNPVELARRPLLSRVLCALREAETHTDGVLPTERIFAVAWPGERASAAARDNRVRVAVCSLRKLGLPVRFDRKRGGYFLHHRVLSPPALTA